MAKHEGDSHLGRAVHFPAHTPGGVAVRRADCRMTRWEQLPDCLCAGSASWAAHVPPAAAASTKMPKKHIINYKKKRFWEYFLFSIKKIICTIKYFESLELKRNIFNRSSVVYIHVYILHTWAVFPMSSINNLRNKKARERFSTDQQLFKYIT